MNTTAIPVIVFLLAFVLFATNALTAIVMISGRKDELKNTFSGKDKSMDELHKRVKELEEKK